MDITRWFYTSETTPFVWETGEWDGKRSGLLVVECKDGEQYLAYYHEGILDEGEFKNFETKDGTTLEKEVIRFLPIPD